MKQFLASLLFFIASFALQGQRQAVPPINLAKDKPVAASTETGRYPAKQAVDGIISRESKWMTPASAYPPHTLDIDLQGYHYIDSITVHTGIPELERTSYEQGQAAGFWAVKHLQLQYWDDANWTDIPRTEITENRQTAARFHFSPAIITYKLRLAAFDGEPLNVMEIEAFGKEVPGMALPEVSNTSNDQKSFSASNDHTRKVFLKIHPEVVGKTMKYVGYNQAYYLPGSNVSRWLEYSEVNSLRVWTSMSNYVPLSCVEVDSTLSTLSDFEIRKRALRADPEHNRFIHWNPLEKIYAETDWSGTNAMVFDYVLEEARRLGIEVLLQINERRFDDTWAHRWQQWQRFYALAYHAARKGDVSMFAFQNEPNHRHSGPMDIETWIRGMQVVSDAIRCAVVDVNRIYGKQLTPRFVGPVTAGTNVDWWAEVIRNIRTNYRGEQTSYDLIDIFSTHSYNSPAAGYATRVESIRNIIRENHPAGDEIPVVFTEIGRWMNAYLIDKEETMDSPSLFTEWAGIYHNNMMNGGYGMWAFKFANNVSSTYSMGIKSGHHFTWNGKRLVEDAWDNLAFGKPVKAGSTVENGDPELLTDGTIDDSSSLRFSPGDGEKWVEIDLGKEELIGSALVYTGSAYGVFTGPDRLKSFTLQFKRDDEWLDIPGASVAEYKYVQALFEFKAPVSARFFRLLTAEKEEITIREIKLFAADRGAETAPVSYDISGIQRAGEVVRLFAKGFKEQRDLLRTEVSVEDPGLDASACFDPGSGRYYLWLVQRAAFNYPLKVNLSDLRIPAGHPMVAEAVGPNHYGEVIQFAETNCDSEIEITLPGQTALLLTIPPGDKMRETSISPASAVTVSGDGLTIDSDKLLKIALDGSNKNNNKVSYVHFKPPVIQDKGISQLSLVGFSGFIDQGSHPVRIHVYGFPAEEFDVEKIRWENAPYLDGNDALIKHGGQELFFAGELAFDGEERYHFLDVTRHAGKYPGGIAFILIRETRHLGDYQDKGRNVVISSVGSGRAPVLINYCPVKRP